MLDEQRPGSLSGSDLEVMTANSGMVVFSFFFLIEIEFNFFASVDVKSTGEFCVLHFFECLKRSEPSASSSEEIRPRFLKNTPPQNCKRIK